MGLQQHGTRQEAKTLCCYGPAASTRSHSTAPHADSVAVNTVKLFPVPAWAPWRAMSGPSTDLQVAGQRRSLQSRQ